jgi:DNA recombination protein RmuC
LKLAATKFQTLESSAKSDLDKRQLSIDQLVKPLKESLERYEKQIREMEIKREGAYAGLGTHLSDLQKLTGDLNTALRGSHTKVRGRWGELTLHRVAELAGMSEFCDFTEQENMDSDAGRQRPDMIVNLPGGRRFPVDSKVPLGAFLGAVSAATEEERINQLSQHGRLVRAHMERLAKQGYPELFRPAPDIVVMFLPGESFLAAALEQDGQLLEDAMQKRVMLATPTVLISLLLAVHHGWQQQEVAKSAAEIRDLGKTLYERMGTATEYFAELGAALGKAMESYNSAIGSLETRFFPAARKFKDLAVPAGNDLAVLEPVEERPRMLMSPEWETEGGKRDSSLKATERSRAAGE